MKHSSLLWSFPASGLMLLATSSQLRADFLKPVAVLAGDNSYNNQENLISGDGWVNDTNAPVGSPFSIDDQNASHMWYTGGGVKQSLLFDLGQTVDLTKVYIWNFNLAGYENGGFRDVEVSVSGESDLSTASNFNAIAQLSLTEGGTNGQAFDVAGTGVRLVRLQNLTGWGSGFLIGLNAVRFGSGTVAGRMPWIQLNHPTSGDEFGYHTNRAGADILCAATVTDPDGLADIRQVQIFDVTTTSNITTTLLATMTNAPYTVVLSGITNGVHIIRAVATDQSGKVAWTECTVTVRRLYADRVIKLDDLQDMGPGLNQIAYYGLWSQGFPSPNDDRYNQGDHYDGTANDYYEVQFRGAKIDVYATVASYHGSGMASIDGGPESAVNFKSDQRLGQFWVYGSPVLSNGVHVLRMRVVGDGVVTADRFDIQVYDLAATRITKINDLVSIDLDTPNPDLQHQLLASTDLVTWQPVTGAVLTKTGDHTVNLAVSGVAGAFNFYRAVMSP